MIHRISSSLSIAIVILVPVFRANAQNKNPTLKSAILIGRSVHVSADNPKSPHAETFIAVNPKDPSQMLATSIIQTEQPEFTSWVYASRDGGSTWQRPTGASAPNPLDVDPIVLYDNTGSALFSALGPFRVWRSTDGGLNWNSGAQVPGGSYDRQYLAVDRTSGPYAGRIYAAGTIVIRQPGGNYYAVHAVSYSMDHGLSFAPAVILDNSVDGKPGSGGGDIGDLLVTSRGTLVMLYTTVPEGPAVPQGRPPRQLWTIVSENGGRRFSDPRPGLRSLGRGPTGYRNIKTASIIRAAIDQSNGPFADRIYVVWNDFTGGRYDIKVTHSDDLGVTWSPLVKVNDNVGPNDTSNPAIAVNKDGILAVIWNDRRDDPNCHCYRLYVSASLDGGETFLPNVQVNPHPTCTNAPGNWFNINVHSYRNGIRMTGVPDRFPNGGDTQGLASGQDGRFHAAWINGESGVTQLWYTDFTVQGGAPAVGVSRAGRAADKTVDTAVGSPSDRTNEVSFEVSSRVIDFGSKAVGFTVALKNQTSAYILGPLMVVLDSIESDFKGLAVVKSDNGSKGKGAEWKFLASGRGLKPGEVSETRQILWRFDGQVPNEPTTPLYVEFRVLSKRNNAPSPGERREAGSPSAESGAKLSSELATKIKTSVEATLKAWNIPGAAVGIVRDGKVVFLEGFGKRDVEKNLPATPQTRFILGSTTKAFTTMAIGLLAAEDKLDWDKPVSAYLPDFRLMDEHASLHATVRDLAAHRTGLPRHDLVWVNSPLDLGEMVRSLRFLEPSRELRAAFQYNNLMYITLGYLVEKAGGVPWDACVREKVFKPLGMSQSGCTIPEYTASPEYAFSYRFEEKKHVAQPLPQPADKLMYGARASGSVNTTAADMCRWMSAHLQAGEVDGKQVFPANVVREMHTPQIPIPWNPGTATEILSPSYALGWMTDSYRGHWRVHHGGSTLEFNSYVALFPQDKTGVVVLINSSSPANNILAHTVSDLALGLSCIDWTKRAEEQIKAGRRSRPQEKRVEGTSAAHKLEDYEGDYLHPAYGTLRVWKKDGTLRATLHGFELALEHWHYETFIISEGEFRSQKLTFQTHAKGEVSAVSGNFEPSVKDIVFERRPKS